ncbi:MAG: glycoside hydrolase family 5 protein [Thalassotalea sp.]|nr:glycoside hydrolase family 5 protein [Thalassotalea sp.]
MTKHIKKILTKTPYLFIYLNFILLGCGGSGASSPSAPQQTSQPSQPTEVRLTLPDVVQNTLTNDVSPSMAIVEMGIGINLGNTLDAPTEGEWALPAEEYYIEAFSDAGFNHVRIPITWHNHVSISAPYEIEEAFINRVEQIVDWSLARDLYVIINIHHDDWFKNDYDNVSNQNRFDSIWIKLAETFKEKSPRLIFEIFNEPHGLTVEELNIVNKRALSIIRNQTANRLVVFAGNEYSNIDTLLTMDIPDVDDKYLIGNFHSYDPWNFAGICTQEWGSDQDKLALREIYLKAHNWSSSNNISVMVNEFGSAKYDFENPENICEQAEREDYIRTHVSLAKEFGIAATFWDDGGSFSTYDRANNVWGPEKDILTEHQ